MSCKRSDINNLIGCRIGDVAVRGCSRGCCYYKDADISENTRHHLLLDPSPSYRHQHCPPPPGRKGLNYTTCQTSWRPKFICPKPKCRRGVKPAYDPDKNDYRISDYGDWEVRPKPNREPGLKEAIENHTHLLSKNIKGTAEKREIDELSKRHFDAEKEGLTKEEMERLRKHDPEVWWRKVVSISRTKDDVEESLVRCSSCGENAIRVGSNFRLPKKTDEKGWKEVEEMIANGEDMVAKFLVCSTVEVHEEMLEEAQRRVATKQTEDTWLEEKKRRIEALGLNLKNEGD